MKTSAISCAFGLLGGGLLSAQGLYNIMPYDDEPQESSPLEWIAGASIGYDSNPTPTFSKCDMFGREDSGYISAFVQANFASKTPQTTWDVWGRVGVTYYFNKLEQPGTTADTERWFPNVRGGFNFYHRFNDRTRFRSRSFVAYETEPDFDNGLGTDRRQGNYFSYSTDNSIGHRWTERFGTVTGYRFSGVVWQDLDGEDYMRHLIYNQFRYRSSPTTVWTGSYRYGLTQNDEGSDPMSHYFLLGVEKELSPRIVVVLRGGAQYYDPRSNLDTAWSPYVEGVLRARWTEKFSTRTFIRYGIEGNQRTVATHDCDEPPVLSSYGRRNTWRSGTQGSYIISEKLTLFGGANNVFYQYDDLAPGSAGPSNLDEWIFHANIGASYKLTQQVSLTTSYNFTYSRSDADIRDYDRHRIQVGAQATF